MDKQSRLSSLIIKLSDIALREESLLCGAELSVKAREYNHLEHCASKLSDIYREKKAILKEAKEIQMEVNSDLSKIATDHIEKEIEKELI
jgi:hypothetical protein